MWKTGGEIAVTGQQAGIPRRVVALARLGGEEEALAVLLHPAPDMHLGLAVARRGVDVIDVVAQQQEVELATRLRDDGDVDAARQLVPLAAAVPPGQRAAWAERQRTALTPGPQWEALVASLALAWVGSAGFATDVLWSDRAAPGPAGGI